MIKIRIILFMLGICALLPHAISMSCLTHEEIITCTQNIEVHVKTNTLEKTIETDMINKNITSNDSKILVHFSKKSNIIQIILIIGVFTFCTICTYLFLRQKTQ